MSDAVRRADPHGGSPRKDATTIENRFLLAGVFVLLCMSFIAGGSSQQTNVVLSLTQLIAIPVLLWAGLLAIQRDRIASAKLPIAVVGAIMLVPVLQLVPIPASFWAWPDLRSALARDLAAADVVLAHTLVTLTPAATRRAALFLLPAAALFVSALALGRTGTRWLLGLVLGMIVMSLILAFAQLGLPQDSFLNPFPQYVPTMGGVFANHNHQADALVVGLVVSLAMRIHERRKIRRGGGSRGWARALLVFTVFFAIGLLLVRSRAGILIGILATLSILGACQALPFWRPDRRWPVRLLTAGSIGILVLVTYVALSWLNFEEMDAVSGTRGFLTAQTVALGDRSIPLGTGVGSFVRIFEQDADKSLLQYEYINHAHNEYAQWWLEGGILSVACMLAALWVLLAGLRRLLRLHPESRQRVEGFGALVSVIAILVHSCVDYPLRTPALTALTALLAGVFVFAAWERVNPSRQASE